MKTLLVFPPQAHPTQPALCLPSLVAYLRANGFPDTHQRDLNLECHDYFLSRERLDKSRDRVHQAFEKLPGERALALPEMDRFRQLAEAEASADSVVEETENAKRTLRDLELFYDYDRYLRAVKTLDRAFRLVSAEFYPSLWTPHNYSLRQSIEREAEVLDALLDERSNFFLEYLRERALPEILAENPELLGISLTYTSQVIPGLSLALLVKQVRPDIHVTVGGGLLAYLSGKLTQSGKVFDAIDSLIVLEGEGPLLELARSIAQGQGPENVPNCTYRKDGEVRTNAAAPVLDINSLPTPVFDGLPMDRYYSPQLALPLAITRGCYWEKCAFCTLYKVIGPGYRQRDLKKVMDDIETVTQRWRSNVIYFIVEDMPPAVFKALPAAVRERNLDIRWWTDARLERNLFTKELCREIHESGCRRIAFGFESASQRLLDRMEKGTSLTEADTIVHNLAEAGVSITLYTMIGFPTETALEARGTLEWLRDHKNCVHEVSLRIFYIDHLSKVFAHPEDYDIEKILVDEDKDLQVYYDWVGRSGMDRKESRELFFEFMKTIREEFPLFRGDNLLLFELKSHYFLYLCRFGDLSFLERKESVDVAQKCPEDLRAARPRSPRGNKHLCLSHDLRLISNRLNEAECAVLRPRYQSGNFKEQIFAEMTGAVEPVPARPTDVVYRAASGDLLYVGKDAANILDQCDGSRTIGEILDSFPEEWAGTIKKFFGNLFEKGLLTADAERRAEKVKSRAATHVAAGCEHGLQPALELRKETANPVRAAETMHLYCQPRTR